MSSGNPSTFVMSTSIALSCLYLIAKFFIPVIKYNKFIHGPGSGSLGLLYVCACVHVRWGMGRVGGCIDGRDGV